MSDDTPEHEREVADAVLKAVRAALGQYGIMANKVVVLADSLDPDGERALWLASDRDAKAWDTLGLLHFAIQQEQAGYTVSLLDE